jgi:protein-disulfide isomerase
MIWGVSSGASIKPPFEANAIHPLDNVKGNASSSVIVIEYSDFQCPACRSYYPIMRELTTEFGDRVAFVYRHFPLTEIHKNAEAAARAAQAAGKQGKFWEMHDLLFEKQNEWANVSDTSIMFQSYASLLGISVEQFKADFNSGEIKNFVKAQRSSALKLKLPGTPSYLINGQLIQNPTSVDEFRTVIKNVLKSN